MWDNSLQPEDLCSRSCRSSLKEDMTKSHKLFQLINQISVMRVWGYTCMQGKGLGFLLSVLFMALLCRLWVTQAAGDSELHWAHLTVRHVPYTRSHPQCLIGYQPLDAPPKPVFTFSSPKPRHFTDPPPAWLLITLEFYQLSATLSCIFHTLSEMSYFLLLFLLCPEQTCEGKWDRGQHKCHSVLELKSILML